MGGTKQPLCTFSARQSIIKVSCSLNVRLEHLFPLVSRVSDPDPDPVGSGVFALIRIRFSNFSGSGSGFQISLDPDPDPVFKFSGSGPGSGFSQDSGKLQKGL